MCLLIQHMSEQIHIDYLTNPLAIVRRYDVPYGDGLKLDARVRAIVEEGFNHATFFTFELHYPGRGQIGGSAYRSRRGSFDVIGAQQGLEAFCAAQGLTLENHRFL